VLTYLPPAPVGYRYQRVGGDLVLVHISDRVVVDIMLNIF
jgi:Ni/Co efflux regulator RcnB